MKPIKSLVAFLVTAITLISLTSCQKEVSYELGQNGNNNNNNSSGNFTANINGGNWKAAADKQSATIMDGVINLTGISSNGQMMTITLTGDTIGTYDVSFAAAKGFVAFEPDYTKPANVYSSMSSDVATNANGTVTVTSIDTDKKIIKGTFQSKLFNPADGTSYTATEGLFELTYFTSLPTDPTGPTTPPATGDAYLKATINGTAWQAKTITAQVILGQIYIAGADEHKVFAFTIPPDAKVGSYTYDPFSQLYTTDYSEINGMDAKMYSAESGTLKITQHDPTKKTMTATFEFVGRETFDQVETRQITKGSFFVKYQ
ncbi:DUF6252 family protein [Pinibacter aurantiacus]|uniref:Lipocalin-like domain-containing protein n=1 Tax=Pinibacter aurantiacus TaxID=2851599 RepID=A0A9E2W244_9BACT|nr:DUF6252 family protein [Pinibacter aurantiacus]MBV4356895.1 hypothetical protein [Pinibacter aurantiacus]